MKQETAVQRFEDAMDKCPKCGMEFEMGFGLAGGGYGAYQYCPKCEEIVQKWQEPDVEPGEPPHR